MSKSKAADRVALSNQSPRFAAIFANFLTYAGAGLRHDLLLQDLISQTDCLGKKREKKDTCEFK